MTALPGFYTPTEQDRAEMHELYRELHSTP